MHVLRAERGFPIVGQETDGSVTAGDLGLDRMIAWTKPDFVGKRSLARSALATDNRRQLVGLLTERSTLILDPGAQILARPADVSGGSVGHVTSSYWSSNCGRAIALALIERGRCRTDELVHVTHGSGFATARVTAPVFIDPEGVRVNGIATTWLARSR